MAEPDELAGRRYLMTRRERLRRHLRTHLYRAVVGGISSVAVLAGFLSAAEVTWPLHIYLLLTVVSTGLFLPGLALLETGRRHVLVGRLLPRGRAVMGAPAPLPPLPAAERAPTAQIMATACADPIYAAGLRVLLPPNRPLIIVPSAPSDVGRPEELVLPLFEHRLGRSHLRVDLRPFGIPLAPYVVERELSGDNGGADRLLPVRDLAFTTTLAAALAAGSDQPVPQLTPEHCADPLQIAQHDVVIVGGPDTNFWHALLYEPVYREFALPASSVPLAFGMRREREGGVPVYGNVITSAVPAGGESGSRHATGWALTPAMQPAYGMILACRNPLAAALGLSRWCVFVAGTTSLGTAGAMLALSRVLRRLSGTPDGNASTVVPTTHERVHARVSAMLCRVREAEQSAVRSSGRRVIPRQRRRLPSEGPVPAEFGDFLLPTQCEFFDCSSDSLTPRWHSVAEAL